MTTAQPVILQQDGRNKLKISIPASQVEFVIKRAMNYRTSTKYASYLQRLKNEGSYEFNNCIEKLYSRFRCG